MDQQSVNVETYVVSRYIDNPYLIMGKKFDIRMYVLVTSFSPLVAWTYREGFARFSNQRFNLDSIDNNIVHLTNVAIQKTALDYDPEKGAKWSLQGAFLFFSGFISLFCSFLFVFSFFGFLENQSVPIF